MRELLASRRADTDASETVARWVSGKSIAELRAMLADPQTFRDAAIERSDLLTVLEDAQAAPPVRARVAIALASDDEARKRIASARDAAAHPKLRLALERAIEADDEAAEEALHRLEQG